MADLAHVKGLADLQKFMDELAPKMERNVLRGGLRAGARVVQTEAKSRIHSISGETAKSVKVGSRARGGEVIAYVAVSSHKGKWLEYGTRPHKIKPKNRKALAIGGNVVEEVDHPGAKPHPFLRPALDARAGAAVVAVGEYVKKRLADKHGLDTSDVNISEES
jgi:HK97 gp10 family phage protein